MNINITQEKWFKFLNDLNDYLYHQGWYINGKLIILEYKDRWGDYDGVERYLHNHCYSKTEAKRIVSTLSLGYTP